MNIKYIQLLKNEINLLTIILKRIKNQHEPTLIYRRTVHLKRLIKKYLILKNNKESLIENIKKNYILISSNFSLNHFIPLSLVLIGIHGRIYFCIKRINNNNSNNKIKRKILLDNLFN